MNISQVIEESKSLSSNEKALVAHCLISSLETKQDVGVELAWAELSEKRYAELISGKIKPVSWDEIKKEIEG